MRKVIWEFQRERAFGYYCHWQTSVPNNCPRMVRDFSQPPQTWCVSATEANACFLASHDMDCFCSALAAHSTSCCKAFSYNESDPFVALACGEESCTSPAPTSCTVSHGIPQTEEKEQGGDNFKTSASVGIALSSWIP